MNWKLIATLALFSSSALAQSDGTVSVDHWRSIHENRDCNSVGSYKDGSQISIGFQLDSGWNINFKPISTIDLSQPFLVEVYIDRARIFKGNAKLTSNHSINITIGKNPDIESPLGNEKFEKFGLSNKGLAYEFAEGRTLKFITNGSSYAFDMEGTRNVVKNIGSCVQRLGGTIYTDFNQKSYDSCMHRYHYGSGNLPHWKYKLNCERYARNYKALKPKSKNPNVSTFNSYQELENRLEIRYGIEIEFDNIEFPDRWNSPHYEVIPLESRYKFLIELQEDLTKYYDSTIKNNLNVVYSFNKLSLKNLTVGGVVDYVSRSLFLTANSMDSQVSQKRGSAFHHEFAHLLFELYKEQFRIIENRWNGLNPQSPKYPFERNFQGKLEAKLSTTPELHRQGFVTGYGSTAFAEDFADHFALFMSNPNKLLKLGNEYPLIRQKSQDVRNFYNRVLSLQ